MMDRDEIPHGSIWAQYWVSCGSCGKAEPLGIQCSQPFAPDQARDAGWVQRKAYGWVCPHCLPTLPTGNKRHRRTLYIGPHPSERHKRMLAMRDQGMTFSQIAQAENITTERARQLVLRARVLLAQQVDQQPATDPALIEVLAPGSQLKKETP